MALVNAYASTEQLREQFADAGSISDAGILERALNSSSRAIDRYCGRRFYLEAAVSVRLYRPREPDIAWVDDIATTTGLIIKTDPNLDGTWSTTWDAADYLLEPLDAGVAGAGTTAAPHAWWRIAAIGTKYFPVSARRVTLQVTARRFWSAIPDEIGQACLLKAAGLVKRKDSPHGIMGFDGFGAVRITRQDPDVIALLRPYMRLQIGAV